MSKKEQQEAKLISSFISEAETLYSEFGDFIHSRYNGDNSSEANYYTWASMKFNTSWDWLMPVVEKIESLNFDNYTVGWESSKNFFCFYKSFDTGEREDTINVERSSNIESAYHAVVKFIQWYNTQPTKQP